MHERDKALLEQIKNLFGVGTISKHGPQSLRFIVQSIKDMKIIIDFLDKYPLISEKYSNFLLFKEVFHIMECKPHLTENGLYKIVAIKASMNRGLSPELKLAFPE